MLLDELFRRDLEKLREGSSSKGTGRVTCWAMRRGAIFEPQRGNCVWHLQHQHPLLGMLWGFVRIFSFYRIPFLLQGTIYAGGAAQEAQRDVSYQALIAPPCSLLCSQKSGIWPQGPSSSTSDLEWEFWLLLGQS